MEPAEANVPETAAPEKKERPELTLHTNPGEGVQSENMDMVLDIPLRVSVELGRAKVLVADLLSLHKGSVIELNKVAGETLEVLVNDRVLARGEVVVVNEKFGIRLTDIVSHAQRIRQLGE